MDPRSADADTKTALEQRASLVRVILEAVPGGVVHVATDGSIVEANAEALRILGYRFDSLTQSFITSFETTTVHEDGTPCAVSEYPVARVLATGEPQPPLTIGVRRPDGETSWAVFRAVPARDATGRMTGAIVTFLDITERKRAEDDLRKSEARWRSLASNLPDYVVIVDREARIQWISRVLDGYDPDAVIGTDGSTYIDPEYSPDWQQRFESALETREVVRFETRGRGPNGDIRWYETTFVPLLDEPSSDRVERLLLLARDVTERRMMFARLAEKERLASVGMLAASVAHEIMNPLTYVLANLDYAMSERSPADEEKAQALSDARSGAARMQQIVRDLRSLGRTGAEELFYVDVRSVIETAFRLAGPEVSKNVHVDVALDEVPGVLASESRLCQVFINLIVNAVQAMSDRPAGERAIRVRTRADERAGLVVVEISDTGFGIAPEHIGRIFDPLFTTKPSGTGLGLSISKDSVEKMGGRIDVTSHPGRGTTFSVWLSTKRAPAQDDP